MICHVVLINYLAFSYHMKNLETFPKYFSHIVFLPEYVRVYSSYFWYYYLLYLTVGVGVAELRALFKHPSPFLLSGLQYEVIPVLHYV